MDEKNEIFQKRGMMTFGQNKLILYITLTFVTNA